MIVLLPIALLSPALAVWIGSMATVAATGVLAGEAVAEAAAATAAALGPIGLVALAVAVVAVGGYILYNEIKKTDEKSQDIPDTDAPTDTQKCEQDPNKEKKIRSLEKRLQEHQKKLEEYKSDPDAFDNNDFLKNAPSPEVRQRIIDGRIRHLENEIKNFQKQIDDLKGC